MTEYTYYTALGHFRRHKDGAGKTHPVVVVNRREYDVDLQEMTLWACLNWRILDAQQALRHYDSIAEELVPAPKRSFEDCLDRLLIRGLAASGTGGTGFDALYDLLGGLYVVPISESLPLRLATFLKMTVLDGVPVSQAKLLFRRDRPDERERQVLALSRQALLSTAELIKCAQNQVCDLSSEQKILEALYSDEDTTSDNIADAMRGEANQKPVTVAVANLYLRKRIILERVSV
jgi:hypothetical protein